MTAGSALDRNLMLGDLGQVGQTGQDMTGCYNP
jgi:hypothetical protein